MIYLLDQFAKYKLSVDPLDYLGFTPLLLGIIIHLNLIACYRGYDTDEFEAQDCRYKIVESLIKMGANVNFVKDRTQYTALHWAAFNNDKQVV
jgi:hypothetical protein